MRKWDKINKKFDDVLETFTKEDWIKWDSDREVNSNLRRKELIYLGNRPRKKLIS